MKSAKIFKNILKEALKLQHLYTWRYLVHQQQNLNLQVRCTSVDGLLKRLNDLKIEEKFKVIYQNRTEQAQGENIEIPKVILGHSR